MRVGTLSHSDLLLQHMLRQQNDMVRSQEQVATGKKYNDLQGFGSQSSHLVSTKSLLNQIEGHQKANHALLGRLDAFNTGLTELERIGGEFRDAIHKARGNNNGTGLQAEVSSMLQRAVSVLNTRFEGRFLFGGANTDQAPVTVGNEAEILAIAEPPAGQFFTDSGSAPTVRLDERATLTAGVAASEVAGDLLHAMQRVLMFDSGTLPAGAGAFAPAGSLDGQLSQNESDYLADELNRVLSAVDTLQTAATENGLNMKAVDAVQTRLGEQEISLTEIVAGVENVDLAEVAAKLNRQQVTLEASFRMIAEMRSLNLFNAL